MRIAYVDCFSGISGDMFLAALLGAGVPPRLLEEATAALGIGARLQVKRVVRSGIAATKVDVLVEEAGEHVPHHGHAHKHEHGRSLSAIRRILAAAAISASAKRRATAIFEALGAAEAKIHNVDIEKVHFHEVGAADALVDIVCAAVGSEALNVDEWVFSPLNVGGGTVHCAHGTFPVPAPATVELLQGAPLYSTGLEAELVTPTGAAIARVLAARFAEFPRMKVESAGYGAGTRDFPAHANVLRITVGEALAEHPAVADTDTVAVLEANLDDLNPQLFGYLMDRALAEGALEVFATPVQMKKNRPGLLLTVLCRRQDAERMVRLVFSETTTLGVRLREEQRRVLPRRIVEVETRWGKVRLKVANLNGTVANYAPEYEDCRRLAAQHHVPLKQVMEEAVQSYLRGQSR
jgi:uncharacterized protein (TIGR00299 family) protein